MKETEFYKMYTDKSHPYYLDFDQYEGSYPVTYYSNAEGATVTDSVYAAAGNWVYGAVGILGGIPKEFLTTAANWTQHGEAGTAFWNRIDHPHDAVNVQAGIANATEYLRFNYNPTSFFQLGPPSSPVGTAAPDAIMGSAGADYIAGSAGDYRIAGEAANDELYGMMEGISSSAALEPMNWRVEPETTR